MVFFITPMFSVPVLWHTGPPLWWNWANPSPSPYIYDGRRFFSTTTSVERPSHSSCNFTDHSTLNLRAFEFIKISYFGWIESITSPKNKTVVIIYVMMYVIWSCLWETRNIFLATLISIKGQMYWLIKTYFYTFHYTILCSKHFTICDPGPQNWNSKIEIYTSYKSWINNISIDIRFIMIG